MESQKDNFYLPDQVDLDIEFFELNMKNGNIFTQRSPFRRSPYLIAGLSAAYKILTEKYL